MLPSVDFCGLNVTRLIMGANPFAGYSHQSAARDAEMIAYYTVPRIHETWRRAEAAGINTFVTNNHTEHVNQAVAEYLANGGALQWIAQVSAGPDGNMAAAINRVVEIGCKAFFIHGAYVDKAFAARDEAQVREWAAAAKKTGLPFGVAGHNPDAHRWINSMNLVDFHAVCFFDCGSVHESKGEKFRLQDVLPAVETIQAIPKPCIAYKIMGAGRIDARMAFEFAFAHIKPGDVINVGMHRGDKDDMVEENARIVADILA